MINVINVINQNINRVNLDNYVLVIRKLKNRLNFAMNVNNNIKKNN